MTHRGLVQFRYAEAPRTVETSPSNFHAIASKRGDLVLLRGYAVYEEWCEDEDVTEAEFLSEDDVDQYLESKAEADAEAAAEKYEANAKAELDDDDEKGDGSASGIRCEATTKSGSRCRKASVEGSPFCASHKPGDDD